MKSLLNLTHYNFFLIARISSISFKVERAFQKQQGVNLNRNIKFISKKSKSTRLHRNVGLGFKTPKEVNKQAKMKFSSILL
jgi:Ribosomal_S17 N-terminal